MILVIIILIIVLAVTIITMIFQFHYIRGKLSSLEQYTSLVENRETFATGDINVGTSIAALNNKSSFPILTLGESKLDKYPSLKIGDAYTNLIPGKVLISSIFKYSNDDDSIIGTAPYIFYSYTSSPSYVAIMGPDSVYIERLYIDKIVNRLKVEFMFIIENPTNELPTIIYNIPLHTYYSFYPDNSTFRKYLRCSIQYIETKTYSINGTDVTLTAGRIGRLSVFDAAAGDTWKVKIQFVASII